MTPAISVADLSHTYGSNQVLFHTSFEVPQGSFFTIIGPNGSGKSTLMKILAGVLRTKTGEITISGKNIKEFSRKSLSRSVAFVPQAVSEEFPFRVEELVLLGRAPHQGFLGMNQAGDTELARRAMEFTGVAHLSERRLDQISGGERQRVLIARAICQQTSLMLLDEPASALDLAHQVKLMDLLDRLRKETGMGIVMVSHDINLAAMYADTMLILSRGRVIRCGPPGDILDAETLENLFNCPFLVDTNPLGGSPRIFPVPARFTKQQEKI